MSVLKPLSIIEDFVSYMFCNKQMRVQAYQHLHCFLQRWYNTLVPISKSWRPWLVSLAEQTGLSPIRPEG